MAAKHELETGEDYQAYLIPLFMAQAASKENSGRGLCPRNS